MKPRSPWRKRIAEGDSLTMMKKET